MENGTPGYVEEESKDWFKEAISNSIMLLYMENERPDAADPQALQYFKRILFQVTVDQKGLYLENRHAESKMKTAVIRKKLKEAVNMTADLRKKLKEAKEEAVK